MTRAEQKALEVFGDLPSTPENQEKVADWIDGYEQAEKDTIKRADQWLHDIFSQFDITDSNGCSIDIATFRRIFRETMEE